MQEQVPAFQALTTRKTGCLKLPTSIAKGVCSSTNMQSTAPHIICFCYSCSMARASPLANFLHKKVAFAHFQLVTFLVV